LGYARLMGVKGPTQTGKTPTQNCHTGNKANLGKNRTPVNQTEQARGVEPVWWCSKGLGRKGKKTDAKTRLKGSIRTVTTWETGEKTLSRAGTKPGGETWDNGNGTGSSALAVKGRHNEK